MLTNSVKISDRVESQIPQFIREEDRQFVELLKNYYKSQEKVGKPVYILNNLLSLLDVQNYDFKTLNATTTTLNEVGVYDDSIQVENVSGFLEFDGTVIIDDEVIYYDRISKGPEVVITPGISSAEYLKRQQELENIFLQLDGTKTVFDLRLLGNPVTPVSEDHLIVTIYGETLIPNVDYFLEGDKIRFAVAPRQRVGTDSEGSTKIIYLIGFSDSTIRTLDDNTQNNTKFYSTKLNSQPYSIISEISAIIIRNGILQKPYIDFSIFDNQIIFKNNIYAAEAVHIRTIEFATPIVGSGAEAIAEITSEHKLGRLIVKNGGSGYDLNFTPKVTISRTNNGGFGATATSLVSGVKSVALIDGGFGYNSYNPPYVVVEPPTNPNGTAAKISLEVNNTTGKISSLNVEDSGSGYDFIPAITFRNPGGAKITKPTIDSLGRVNIGSIQVISGGSGYKNPPVVYIDPAPEGGIRALAEAVVSPDGTVVSVNIINRGRGYTSIPRVAIVDPVGAQVLDVRVVDGNVTDIELLTGGEGYEDVPSIYIVDNRKDTNGNPIGGTGAKAAATIFNGRITDINVLDFGSGYSETEPPSIFIASPSAAKASCEVGFNEVTGFTIIESGQNYEPSALVGCKRGVSGVTSFDLNGHQVFKKESELTQSSHPQGSTVTNLDSLFVKHLLKKFLNQYIPNSNIDISSINPAEIIKNIRQYYSSKGTKLSTQFIFKILFGENADVAYPRDEIISPSAATWSIDTIIRVEVISGDPVNIKESQLIQYDSEVDQNVKDASALVENVIAINQENSTIYELAISEETLVGNFVIPYKTTLVEPLSVDDQIITVDSTIGWPARNGTILINNEEEVQYKEKTLNQFIECTRSENGLVEDWDPGTPIYSDIFVYVNRGTSLEVKMRILGIAEANTTVLDDTGSYYLPGDKLTVSKLGSSATDERLQTWLYNVKKLVRVVSISPGSIDVGTNQQTATVVCSNAHGLLVGDSVTIYGANPVIYNGTFFVTSRLDEFTFSYQIPQPSIIAPQGNILVSVDLNRGKSDVLSINNTISDYTTNIQNAFFNAQYVYIAASGLPNYKVGPFVGSALIPGNQRKLYRFPRKPLTVSNRREILPGPIASLINGVSVWSYKANEKVLFGGITSVSIVNPGQGYDAGTVPNLSIVGGGGTGAAARVTINGSLYSFDVVNGGSGYTSSPLISIVGGGGAGATATAVITNGRVSRVLVENPGSGYTSQPTVSITGGGGSGAEVTAQVRGPVQSIEVLSEGQGYTSPPSIILSSGEDALAQPVIINGRIVSIAIINSGQGYTSPPNVIINGDGFGAQAKAIIGTIGEDKGKVISVQITNKGIGYTQGNTTIRLEAVGQSATFEAEIFSWIKNQEYLLSSKYDKARGYVFSGYNNQYGGEYAHISDPKELRYVVGDNVFLDQQTNRFKEVSSNYKHSPIIGWAFDGNPIYGPYGYLNPTEPTQGIKRMNSSYAIKENLIYDPDTNPQPTRIDGPSLSEYPAGTFINDYEFRFQYGDLDPYNGRFCKTPEYPEGTYAYFITIDASEAGLPVFPYILGPNYNSLPDEWNFNQSAIQENIPTGVVRYRDPYENVDIDIERQPNRAQDGITLETGDAIILELEDLNRDGVISPLEEDDIVVLIEEQTLQIFDYFPAVSLASQVDIEVETTTKFEDAKIDGFVIENPGISYQVGDILFFDNTDTQGFGASAEIESIVGNKVVSYNKSLVNDQPYGTITTEGEHELRVGDEVIVDTYPLLDATDKRFKVKVVSGVETIEVTQEGVGYIDDIPPVYELITTQGQDADFKINLESTGNIRTVDIINSGNNYSTTNPPQIRVTHPQVYKKARYFFSDLKESNGGKFEIADSTVTLNRELYVCGNINESNGNVVSYLAKYDDQGKLIWWRTLIPAVPESGSKRCIFKKLYVDTNSGENDTIYVVGETYPNVTNLNYNPDVFVAKYVSTVDFANNPIGSIVWKKEIAGISGLTRRDYVTSVVLDQDKNVYIGGYTDTNSLNPDDMWIIQMNNDGDVKEKRKIASASGSERLNDIIWLNDNELLFVGTSATLGTLLLGKIFYDGANIEVEYMNSVAFNATVVNNPRIVKDEEGDFYVTFNAVNSSTQKREKVVVFKFNPENPNTLIWSKSFTPSLAYNSIEHANIKTDIFGNIALVTSINYGVVDKQIVVTTIKYDGTILYQSTIKTPNFAGLIAKTHSVDNSGDIIITSEKEISRELAYYEFNDTANIATPTDSSKRSLGVTSWFNSSNVEYDSTFFKFGGKSAKTTSQNSLSLADINTAEIKEWTVEGFFQMESARHAVNHKPEIISVGVSDVIKYKVIVDGDTTSANYGKIQLISANSADVNTVLVSSTSTSYWNTIGVNNFNLFTLEKTNPSLGNYVYRIYFNGSKVVEYTTTNSVNLNDVRFFGPATPTSTNSWIGRADDLVVAPYAMYNESVAFTPRTSSFVLSTQKSNIIINKFDRQHTKVGTWVLTNSDLDIDTAVIENNSNALSATNFSANIASYDLGAGGLQSLDYNDVVSTAVPGVYSLASEFEIFDSKTATIPSPLGKKLKLTPKVIEKFYIKDSTVSKIDNVRELTLNQNAIFTKGSVLQQYSIVNGQKVVSVFGTIVDAPTINDENQVTYRVGKVFPAGSTFDTVSTTKYLRSTENDINEMPATFTVARTEELWSSSAVYAVGNRVFNDGKVYEAQSAGTGGTIPPTHTTGTISDGVVTWAFVETANYFDIDLNDFTYPEGEATTYADYSRFKPYSEGVYIVQILTVYSGSNFIPNDIVSIGNTITVNYAPNNDTEKVIRVSGLDKVKSISVRVLLEKDVKVVDSERTDLLYISTNSRHNYEKNDILFVEGFSTAQFNGSFFVEEVFSSRDFTFKLRSVASQDPNYVQGVISSVNFYTKHPKLLFVRGHQYVFDLSDSSNFGFYLSFSQDNQYKLEYSFNNIIRSGIPGVSSSGNEPFVRFIVAGEVTNISYYFDPSRTEENSPIGTNSFIDVIDTPYAGTFRITEVPSVFSFRFILENEPEFSSAIVQDDSEGNPITKYSTTSPRAIGPINSIKLINGGGFYQKLPIVSDIASFRQIEKVVIVSGGSEYAPGVYYEVPILGDGEGALAKITVTNDPILDTGVITEAFVTNPGKGYTFASIDIDGIQGILGPSLSGSGAELNVVIPDEGSGASVFLTGKNIGKIKKLKNNEFGFGYSHDYTLKPEITFPINLQLFNTSILSQIKIIDPGSGYSSAPVVVIEGGGGSGAEAEAIVKNNRLSEILIKNPGSGYSSEPAVTLKSEFNYVVNVDLGYLQFNVPHGITTGSEVQLRAENIGSEVGILPQPSSAGLTALIPGQVYYAISGDENSLESDQLKIALTLADALSGNAITFLTQGSGRQVILTEVFGGKAEAIVETSRFLEGERVYQGDNIETASAFGYVSKNSGWQIGPKILKIENYTGDWKEGEKVTGIISRASGVIDNLSNARGVLNIDSITTTPGKFIDDIGKPSEIVQKIQDSFFYQNFSYIIKSSIPINNWKTTVLENNHPVGFKLFGQLEISGGKDISGRKVITDAVKQVNITNYANSNQITSFAAAQPIYTTYNNTEVLFRKKRLTSSEEILTSIVKKIDDISLDFDGARTSFPIYVEGQQVIANANQIMITLNGIIQAPGQAFVTDGANIIFTEPPKPPSKVVYRTARFNQLQIYRIELQNISGIFPELGARVSGLTTESIATVIDSGTTSIDVVEIQGNFQINEILLANAYGFQANIVSVTPVTSRTILETKETITNTKGDIAIVEESNLENGVITNEIAISRTSGTAEFESGKFNIKLNDIIYSLSSKIAAKVVFIAPYRDPVTNGVVDTVEISSGSSFFGLIFQRLVSTTNPNIILDDISKTVINPTKLYDSQVLINDDFLDFEEARNIEIVYTGATGVFDEKETIKNTKIKYGSLTGNFLQGETVRSNKISYANKSAGLFAFNDTITGISSGATASVIGVNTSFKWIYTKNISGSYTQDEYITNSLITNVGVTTSKNIAPSSTGSFVFSAGAQYLRYPSSDRVAFGASSDFTIEFWYRTSRNNLTQTLIDTRTSGASDTALRIILDNADLKVYYSGILLVQISSAVTINTWKHIALVRSSGVLKLYHNGTVAATTYTDTNNYSNKQITVGAAFNGGNGLYGHLSNLQIKKGVADYNANFTPNTGYDNDDDALSFGLAANKPFILAEHEVYAQYSGRTASSTTIKSVNTQNSIILIEDVDLSRDNNRIAASVIEKNIDFIAEEVVGRLRNRYPGFTYPSYGSGLDYCIRDTKEFILPAIISDIKYGGNFNSIIAAKGYINRNNSVEYISNELLQSVYAWRETVQLCVELLEKADTDPLEGEYTNILRVPGILTTSISQTILDEIIDLGDIIVDHLAPTGHRFRDAGDLIWLNRDFIADEVVGWLEDRYTVTVGNVNEDKLNMPGLPGKCARDIREYILPAIITDIITGGNSATNNAIDFYIDQDENVVLVEDELLAMSDALEFTKFLTLKAINNLLTAQGQVYPPGTPVTYQDDYYSAAYTIKQPYRDPTITVDPKGYDPSRSNYNLYIDAANALERNKKVIAEEAVLTMQNFTKYHTFEVPGGRVNCTDDVEDILDAMIHDLRFGGNSRTYEAASMYIDPEDNGLLHIESEAEATKQVFKLVRDIAAVAIRNGFGRDNIRGNENEPVETYMRNAVSDSHLDAAGIIEKNINFIANEAVYLGTQQYPALVIPGGSQNCIDDVKDVLKALVFNLQYGGNNWVFYAANEYVNSSNNLQHITSQAAESVWIFNKARDLAISVMRNTTISVQGTHGITQTFYSPVPTLDIQNPTCQAVASSITSLMSVITDTINNPISITNGTIPFTLPTIWPVQYSSGSVERDVTVVYDTSAPSWGQVCADVISAVFTLSDILIETVENAENNVNYLTSITKTLPYSGNTEYQEYTCDNVKSAISILFDTMIEALVPAGRTEKNASRLIHNNDRYIREESYAQVLLNNPSYTGTVDFADEIIKSIRHDLVTGGNANVIKHINSWFDGEGNFIAFSNINRTRLLSHLDNIRTLSINACKQTLTNPSPITFEPSWVFPDDFDINEKYLISMELLDIETSEFKLRSLFNLYDYSLRYSTLPLNNSVTFIASSNVASSGSTINRPHKFVVGDILEYIPLGESITSLVSNDYFYVTSVTGSSFTIKPEIKSQDKPFNIGNTNNASQQLRISRRTGIERVTTFNGDRSKTPTPISGGFNPADVIYGTTSDAYSELIFVTYNKAKIVKLYNKFTISNVPENFGFANGETVVVQGSTTNRGVIYETNGSTYINLIDIVGTISIGNIIEGLETGTTATIASVSNNMLINPFMGEFVNGDIIFKEEDSVEATISSYNPSYGSIVSTVGGKLTLDVETVNGSWNVNEVVYGSITEKILVMYDNSTTELVLGDYINGTEIIKLSISNNVVDTGIAATYNPGDEVFLLQGAVKKNPGWRATVTKYDYRPLEGIHDLYIADVQYSAIDVSGEATIEDLLTPGVFIGKFAGSNFPVIYSLISDIDRTDTISYGKVVKIDKLGNNSTIWLQDVRGEFYDNMTVVGNNGWSAAVVTAKDLMARISRYFRGFDGSQTTFKLSIANGQPYFPDPAGHLLIFVNGILQPPGGNNAFTAFSDQIQFTEAPSANSEFIGFYVGKLRQLDDISFDFDSLRNSFNLKLNGVFYSLTLTDGVQSNTIRPENNIIVSVNGVLQEPGVGFELVGSRIIFAEVPRAGSTFVAFSYVGSDADVVSADIIPPVEAGDLLQIEGESGNRIVALIESSNSLTTFEYTGTVKGRNALAIAQITKGRIEEVILTSSGSGYVERPQVDIISSTGFNGRAKALIGVSRIDVKSSGIGYALPRVSVETTVPDDFESPVGAPINNGFDLLAGEGIDEDGNPIIIDLGVIAIAAQPHNLTVSQGQIASFTVVASVDNSSTLNYQWQKKDYATTTWFNIPGANQATYTTLPTQQVDNEDEYRVVITAIGCIPVYSNSAILSVQTGATVLAAFSPVQIFNDE
jgi:hypothetical protein